MQDHFNFLLVNENGAVFCNDNTLKKDVSFSELKFFNCCMCAEKKAIYLAKTFGTECEILIISDIEKARFFASKNLAASIQRAIIFNYLFSRKILNTLAKTANVQASDG